MVMWNRRLVRAAAANFSSFYGVHKTTFEARKKGVSVPHQFLLHNEDEVCPAYLSFVNTYPGIRLGSG
jgi:hypothetical protein